MQRIPPETSYYDEQEARKALNFIERVITHPKGSLAGKPFVLEPWQRQDIILPLFGYRTHKGGPRQFKKLIFSVSRKNGKTALSAAIALYLFAVEQRGSSPEVVSCATGRDQASIVFAMAKTMVKNSAVLRDMIRCYRGYLQLKDEPGSFFKPLSSEGTGQHGMSPSCAILDEVAQYSPTTGPGLIESIETGFAERANPLQLVISTAGSNRESNLFYPYYQYAQKVADGSIQDDAVLPAIYSAPDTADWRNPDTWATGNPNLGVSVRQEFLRDECIKAQAQPSLQTGFRIYHLNQWVASAKQWIDIRVWDGGAAPIAVNANRRCWLGLDVAAVGDICSLAVVWEPDADGIVDVRSINWAPEKSNSAFRDYYRSWSEQEHLTLTPGEVLDLAFPIEKVRELANLYNVQSLGLDRWASSQIAGTLIADGVQVVGVGMGFKSMSPAVKFAEILIYSQKLRHGGDPVLAWAVDNTVIVSDPAGNKKPDKSKSAAKIDPCVALLIALYQMDSELAENDGDIFGNQSVFEDAVS